MAEAASVSSYEDYLEHHGTLTYRNVGISMLPMLKAGRDLFTVTKKTDARCKNHDVVLYKRGDKYVLHRIIEVREKDYVILGDNCVRKEYGITDEQILGIMTEFVHKGKTYKADDPSYERYVSFWCGIIPVRTRLLALAYKGKAIAKRGRNLLTGAAKNKHSS